LNRLSWEEPVHDCDHEGVQRGPERPGERVEADLRRRIDAGEWRSGQMLPTVAQLAEHYRVSPGVIQRVERRLADDGLVRVVPRWGTFRA
jgi:DNA-binding GntR family transcriptional regulator